jgi:hypothetical protein
MDMGNGDPEVPELPIVQGYSCATLFLGDINSETWSFMFGVGHGVNTPPRKKLHVKKQEAVPTGRR